jgi:glutamyl-tRNA reductase
VTHVVVIGASHRSVPVELRERLADIPPEAVTGAAEVVVVSTCNRVELYLAGDDPDELAEAALAAIDPEVAALAFRADDQAAALHLCRVASGLDSLVPGESQILGQVRDAYEAGQQAGTVGPMLHRLFRHALRAGKRARTDTAIAESPASVSSAAVELAERVFGDLSSCRVLVLGAGKMGTLTVLSLRARGVEDVVVADRAVVRDALVPELARADIVVCATGSRDPVVTVDDVRAARRARRGRPIFFVDIAVPRDVQPDVNEVDGCYLYDIDDLERVVTATVAGRAAEAARAEDIAAREATEFRAWQLALDVAPAIASLHEAAERIRRDELARAERRLGPLSTEQRRAVEALTSQIVAKLLHAPTIRLKEAAVAAEGPGYAAAVRRLFDLDEPR